MSTLALSPATPMTELQPIILPSLESQLRALALLGCAMVAGMFVLFVATGIGQDPLQFMHSPADYTAILLRRPALLRLCIGLDNGFIIFYSTMWLVLGQLLLRHGAPRMMTIASISLLLAVGALDMLENFHFLSMLSSAELGQVISSDEIRYQVTESLFKFHISYLGLFLLGFVLPRHNWAGRLTAFASWFVQLPVGILIYVAPPSLAKPLVLVRLTYFVTALIATTFLFRATGRSTGQPTDQARSATT